MKLLIKQIYTYCRYLNFWYLLLFFMGIGIFLVFMPKAADDYWFMQYLRPWFEAQGIINPDNGGNLFSAGIPLKELWATWEWRFKHDNIRLCNIVGVFFLLLPKWIGSTVSLIAFVYSVMELFKLMRIDWRHSYLVPFTLLLLLLSLPLYNHFESLVYQFNYIVGTAFCVWYLKHVIISKDNRGERRYFSLFLLCIIIGAWQEAFTIPLIVCTFTRLLVAPCDRRRMIVAIIGLTIGVGLLMIAPGIRERFGVEVANNSSISFIATLKCLVKSQIWFLVATTLGLICIRKRDCCDKSLCLCIMLPLWILCLVSVCLMISANYNIRAAWPSSFFSVFIISGLVNLFFGKRLHSHSLLSKVTGGVIMSVILLSLTLSSIQVFRLRSQINSMVDLLGSTEDFGQIDHVEVDAHRLSSYSAFLNMFPVYDIKRSYLYLNLYYQRPSPWEFVSIIPSSFREFEPDRAIQIGRSNDAWLYDGEIILSYDGDDSGTIGCLVDIDFGKGMTSVPATGSIFSIGSSGRRYIHIIPMIGWYKSHFLTIKEIGDSHPTEIHCF